LFIASYTIFFKNNSSLSIISCTYRNEERERGREEGGREGGRGERERERERESLFRVTWMHDIVRLAG